MVMVARAILVSVVLMLLVLMALPAGGRVRPDISGHGRAVRIGDSGGPASSGGLNGPGIPGGRVWPAGRESPNGFGRSLGVLVVMVVLLAQVAVEALVIPVDTLVLPALMARFDGPTGLAGPDCGRRPCRSWRPGCHGSPGGRGFPDCRSSVDYEPWLF